MYTKTKLLGFLSIAFFSFTSTLFAKIIDAKHNEDAKYDNYKAIFHKLCPIISQFPGLGDLEEFRIRNEITYKMIEVKNEEVRISSDSNKPKFDDGRNFASRIEEYTRLIRILLESLNKKESTAVLEAISVCDQFRDKAISEWNEPKGTVTQEEFKQKLEEIYRKHKTEIESQSQEYRDIKALLSNETEKTDQQISSIEQKKIQQLRQLQKEREEELNPSKLSKANMLILESFLKRIKENEQKKVDLLFLQSKTVNDELTLKSAISRVEKLIEDAESRYKEKKIKDSQTETNRLEADKKTQEKESERRRREEEAERQIRKEAEKAFQIQIKEPRNSGFFSWLFSLFSFLIRR